MKWIKVYEKKQRQFSHLLTLDLCSPASESSRRISKLNVNIIYLYFKKSVLFIVEKGFTVCWQATEVKEHSQVTFVIDTLHGCC